jgi:hypothetical protein
MKLVFMAVVGIRAREKGLIALARAHLVAPEPARSGIAEERRCITGFKCMAILAPTPKLGRISLIRFRSLKRTGPIR